MAAIEITELLGDGIGAELMEATHTLADALPLDFHFRQVDFSLENRNEHGRAVYDEAVHSMEETRVAIKYPTITERESPNAVLRRRLDFSVIHRPVFSMDGVSANFSEPIDLHIIRVATGGTYADPGRMIGTEAAVSLRIVERRPCRNAAIFAFQLAKRLGLPLTSASKHTIQRITDGLFEDIVEEVGERFPEVTHNVELFDALLAKIILKPTNYRIVLCLNEYGDFLSDMACGLVGSIGLGASASYSFTPGGQVQVAMFDPAGGTAPDIAGQNKGQPECVAARVRDAARAHRRGRVGPQGPRLDPVAHRRWRVHRGPGRFDEHDRVHAGGRGRAVIDRARRTSFNEAVEDYDAIRPLYRGEVFDCIAAAVPSGDVLEIGCGTGQATRGLAGRDYTIDALELGPELAARARINLVCRPNVTVRNADFETCELGEYDLVTSFSAFHWIDPSVGYRRAADVLRPGGKLALVWHEHPRSRLAVCGGRAGGVRALSGSE